MLLVACLLCALSPGESSATSRSTGAYAVPAVREPLTTNARSTVIHDTETNALVAHAGRLFAATDQWEYPSPSAAGQVMVKSSRSGPWTVFEQTHSLRVDALDSFGLPADQGLGTGHSLLVTQAIVGGHSRIQWLLDGARSFTNSYALPSNQDEVRAFGAHESGGVWAVYAGVQPAGILHGAWSRAKHTLVFDPTPELTAAPPGSPGLKTQKVTGFADCDSALFVTINTNLYRRNDGRLPPGVPRWVLVYQAPPVGPNNSALRGLTCIMHQGAPALLVSTEGDGDVYRFDHLPSGQLRGTAVPSPGRATDGLVQTLEFAPIPAIRGMLEAEGTTVPGTGVGSVHYVIAAYNNFEPITAGGVERQAFGFEWGYLGPCPPTRTCEPARSFDAAACFAVRTAHGPSQSYRLRCLSGRQFTPAAKVSDPIRSGQAFVSVRTIAPSPFGDGQIYYGGYDCNFNPAAGTAWIATSTLAALHLNDRRI